MPDITIRKLEGDEKLQVMYGLNATPPLTNEQEWKENVKPRERVTYLALLGDVRTKGETA